MAELVNTPPTEVIYLTAGVVSQEYKDFCVKTTDTEIKSYLYRISKRNKTQLKKEIDKQIKRIENEENIDLLEVIKMYYDE